MDKENKYYNLIDSMIRSHKKFEGLEPIVEEIIDRVYEQSKDNLDIIQEQDVLEGYLNRIISTEIVKTPKELGFTPQKQNKINPNHDENNINNEDITISNDSEYTYENDIDTLEENTDTYDNVDETDDIIQISSPDIEVNQDLVEKMINGTSGTNEFDIQEEEEENNIIDFNDTENFNDLTENISNESDYNSAEETNNYEYNDYILNTEQNDELNIINEDFSQEEVVANIVSDTENEISIISENIETYQNELSDEYDLNEESTQDNEINEISVDEFTAVEDDSYIENEFPEIEKTDELMEAISPEETFENVGIFETDNDDDNDDFENSLESNIENNLTDTDNEIITIDNISEDSDINVDTENSFAEESSEYDLATDLTITADENSTELNNITNFDEENPSDLQSDELSELAESGEPDENEYNTSFNFMPEENAVSEQTQNSNISAFEDITTEELDSLQYENEVVEMPNELSEEQNETQEEYMLDIDIPEEVVDLSPSDDDNDNNVEGNDYVINILDEEENSEYLSNETQEDNITVEEQKPSAFQINNQYIANINAEAIADKLTALSKANPDLNILNICELKYKKCYTIEQISENLNMTSDSVIKALSEIISVI